MLKDKLNKLPDAISNHDLEIRKEDELWVCTYSSDYSTLQEIGNKYNRCLFSDEDIEIAVDKTLEWINKYVELEDDFQ